LPARAIHEVIALSFAELEPVFGKLGQCQVDNHFKLRCRPCVDGQLKLYCLVLPGVNYPDLSASTILSGAVGR